MTTRKTSRRRSSLRRNSHRLTDLRVQARDYALAHSPGWGKEILRVWSNPLLTDAAATKHVLDMLAAPDYFNVLPWNIRRSVIQILAETGFPEEALTMRHRSRSPLVYNGTRYTTQSPVYRKDLTGRPQTQVDEHSSEAEIVQAWRDGRLGITTLQRVRVAHPEMYRRLSQLAQNGKNHMTRRTSRRHTSVRRSSRSLRRNTAGKTPLYGYDSMSNAYNVADYPYGRTVRTQIRYWLELGAGKKGWRFVSQTVNPKNGIWNKPKASTYLPLAAAMYLDEKGHVQWTGLSEYSEAKDVTAFLRDFPGADKIFLKQILPMKVRYHKKQVEMNERGESAWSINGVPTVLTEADARRNREELAQWETALAAL